MPGPPRFRTPLLVNHLLSCQKLLPSAIHDRARTVLKFVQKVAKVSPEVVYGDGVERTRDTPESKAFNRKVAAEGIVLLKNKDNILPLTSARKIAVIGPNAQGRTISGGGSAYLKASYIIPPWNGIVEGASEGVEVSHSIGCYGTFRSRLAVGKIPSLISLRSLYSPQIPSHSRRQTHHRNRGARLGGHLL